jgi:3-deoxy-manno-octulosonate cytidylyltransferase (CMP-KDO synthetase)
VADQLLAAMNSTPDRTIIINVQGDQPFLDPALIDAIAASFIARQPTPEALTPINRLSAEKLHNPNVVKVLLATDKGEPLSSALHCARSGLNHCDEHIYGEPREAARASCCAFHMIASSSLGPRIGT